MKLKKTKNTLVSILLLCGLVTAELANAQSINFSVDNFAAKGLANYMFTFNTTEFYAYTSLFWKSDFGPFGEAPTSSTCTAENLSVINGTAGISIFVTGYSLTSFNHLGSGDHRIYSGATGQITDSGNPVLVLYDIVNELTVSYPPPIGTGNFVSGFGQASINVAASDPNWVAELDPLSTGMITFEYSSLSAVAQNGIGYYDVSLEIKPVTIVRNIISNTLTTGTNENANMGGIGLDFFFETANFGGGGQGTDQLFGMLINGNPGGALPEGIASMNTNNFWNLGTTVASFTCNITFDLNFNLPTVFDPSKVVILRRENSNSQWTIWPDVTMLGATSFRANNVTGFSDWNIGEKDDVPLPVELVSFTAKEVGNKVKLQWKTASEFENKGFVLERKNTGEEFVEISSYERNPELLGRGNSSSETNYEFTDSNVILENTYVYRIFDVDWNSNKTFGLETSVSLEFLQESKNEAFSYNLQQNFPNPFNPATEISFSLKKSGSVNLRVFDVSGRLVKTLVSKALSEGSHKVSWNGTDNFGKSVSSGTYYYKISSGSYTETKKMLLLK